MAFKVFSIIKVASVLIFFLTPISANFIINSFKHEQQNNNEITIEDPENLISIFSNTTFKYFEVKSIKLKLGINIEDYSEILINLRIKIPFVEDSKVIKDVGDAFEKVFEEIKDEMRFIFFFVCSEVVHN
jgi:hypothetical protein